MDGVFGGIVSCAQAVGVEGHSDGWDLEQLDDLLVAQAVVVGGGDGWGGEVFFGWAYVALVVFLWPVRILALIV